VPHTHYTHTQPFNGRWSGTTRVGRYQENHSPTHTHPGYQTSFINFLHPLCSVYMLDNTLVQPLSRSSLVLDPLLHTPCISSPSHHLLFAAHAHTNATPCTHYLTINQTSYRTVRRHAPRRLVAVDLRQCADGSAVCTALVAWPRHCTPGQVGQTDGRTDRCIT